MKPPATARTPRAVPRDAAFPYGYKPTDEERKAVAPNEMAAAFMGGRHTVDSNEPDVQHLAQWSMSHVDDCVRAGFKDMKKVPCLEVHLNNAV